MLHGFLATLSPDIFWRNPVTGQNAVWYMNGVTMISPDWLPSFSDPSWSVVGVGDFNSDGKPDILWRNPVTGQNAVWYMNGVTMISSNWLPSPTRAGASWG